MTDLTEYVDAAARAYMTAGSHGITWDELTPVSQHGYRQAVTPVVAAVAPLIERDARAAALEEAAEDVAGLHGWGVLAGCFRCDLRREETTDAEA